MAKFEIIYPVTADKAPDTYTLPIGAKVKKISALPFEFTETKTTYAAASLYSNDFYDYYPATNEVKTTLKVEKSVTTAKGAYVKIGDKTIHVNKAKTLELIEALQEIVK